MPNKGKSGARAAAPPAKVREASSRSSPKRKRTRAPTRRLIAEAVGKHIAAEPLMAFKSSATTEVVSGTDFLGPVSVPSTISAGQVISGTNFLMSPTALPSRISQIGALWERFNFDYLELIYNPQVPATFAGSVMLVYDPDASESTPIGDARAYGAALDDNVTGPVHTQFSLRVRRLDKHTLYYTRDTNSEDRLELQGQIYGIWSGAAPATTTEVGTLSLRYRVTFTKRCYEIAVPMSQPTQDTWTSLLSSPILAEVGANVLGALYSEYGSPWGDACKIGPKGLMLKRGVNLIRTTLTGYPFNESPGPVSAEITTQFLKDLASLVAPAYQSKGMGTVVKGTTAGLADYTTTIEAAVTQADVTPGSTNHVVLYAHVYNDVSFPMSWDFSVGGTSVSGWYITGYQIQLMSLAEWEREVPVGVGNIASNLVWTSPMLRASAVGGSSVAMASTPSATRGSAAAVSPPRDAASFLGRR